jgi:tRNA(His) 5'-end guanylyltransferase
MLQNELDRLYSKYKKREVESLEYVLVPEEKYLCIRLDGFKVSKKHLQYTMLNKRFNDGMKYAVQKLFSSFRRLLDSKTTSAIVCAYVATDEVSIVLRNNNDNEEYARKVMKLCTLFSSSLSVAMTMKQNRIKWKPREKKQNFGMISFDARPIILDQYEISEYLRSRYLVSKRYAYWKKLDLNRKNIFSDQDEVYSDDIKGNIDNCIKMVEEWEWEEEPKSMIDSFGVYFPTKALRDSEFVPREVNDESMDINNLNGLISDMITHLNAADRNI